jgi:hypothetical protein
MTICKANNLSSSSEAWSLKQLTKMAIKRETSSQLVEGDYCCPLLSLPQNCLPDNSSPTFSLPSSSSSSSSSSNETRRVVSRSYSDDTLQSFRNRRRYMRRGSRAPTMFVISKTNLEKCLGSLSFHEHDVTVETTLSVVSQSNHNDSEMDDGMDHNNNNNQNRPRRTKRLSLTTSLYKQLEELSIHSSSSGRCLPPKQHPPQRRYSTLV